MRSLQWIVFSDEFRVRSVDCWVYSELCTMRSVKCAMYSVECTVRIAQCGVYSVECTIQHVQCGMKSVDCTMFYTIHNLVLPAKHPFLLMSLNCQTAELTALNYNHKNSWQQKIIEKIETRPRQSVPNSWCKIWRINFNKWGKWDETGRNRK